MGNGKVTGKAKKNSFSYLFRQFLGGLNKLIVMIKIIHRGDFMISPW